MLVISVSSGSGIGKMWSTAAYILKVTTTGVADRPDVWSEEKKKNQG